MHPIRELSEGSSFRSRGTHETCSTRSGVPRSVASVASRSAGSQNVASSSRSGAPHSVVSSSRSGMSYSAGISTRSGSSGYNSRTEQQLRQLEKKNVAERPKRNENAKAGIPFGGRFEGESSYRDMFDRKQLPEPRVPVHKKASTSIHPFNEESVYRRAYTEKTLPRYVYVGDEAPRSSGPFHGDSNYREEYTPKAAEQTVVMTPLITMSQVPIGGLSYAQGQQTPKDCVKDTNRYKGDDGSRKAKEKIEVFDMKDQAQPKKKRNPINHL